MTYLVERNSDTERDVRPVSGSYTFDALGTAVKGGRTSTVFNVYTDKDGKLDRVVCFRPGLEPPSFCLRRTRKIAVGEGDVYRDVWSCPLQRFQSPFFLITAKWKNGREPHLWTPEALGKKAFKEPLLRKRASAVATAVRGQQNKGNRLRSTELSQQAGGSTQCDLANVPTAKQIANLRYQTGEPRLSHRGPRGKLDIPAISALVVDQGYNTLRMELGTSMEERSGTGVGFCLLLGTDKTVADFNSLCKKNLRTPEALRAHCEIDSTFVRLTDL